MTRGRRRQPRRSVNTVPATSENLEGARIHLGMVLSAIDVLPKFAGSDTELPDRNTYVRVACVESFYMNVRLVVDFFITTPASDISALDFLPTWAVPLEPGRRLVRLGTIASKYIAHMSRMRATLATQANEDTTLAGLRLIADDCYMMLGLFTKAYGSSGAAADPARRSEFVGFEAMVRIGEWRRVARAQASQENYRE